MSSMELEGTEERAARGRISMYRLLCSSVTWMESLALLNIEFTLLTFLYICKIILIKKHSATNGLWLSLRYYNERKMPEENY